MSCNYHLTRLFQAMTLHRPPRGCHGCSSSNDELPGFGGGCGKGGDLTVPLTRQHSVQLNRPHHQRPHHHCSGPGSRGLFGNFISSILGFQISDFEPIFRLEGSQINLNLRLVYRFTGTICRLAKSPAHGGTRHYPTGALSVFENRNRGSS